ncbi:MAG: hypothetical protein LBP59_20220 [Planctomycetaceae bacterium]|nr:hypothetical protein [Planctomycetaceae bacterium]
MTKNFFSKSSSAYTLSLKTFRLNFREFLETSNLYCSYLKFSDLKASKPAVRKLGRRR